MRMVMCKANWPELDQTDFKVFLVKDGETDEEAIDRAKKEYPDQNEFYIKEVFI